MKEDDIFEKAANEDQLTHWSDADEEPYSWQGWWWNGNWLLDGRWHNIQTVRRWSGNKGALLELWIDGTLIAKAELPARVDM